MILDTTVDIYKKETTDGIGSGSDADWDTAREENVPAAVKKRKNLPEVREQIAGSRGSSIRLDLLYTSL